MNRKYQKIRERARQRHLDRLRRKKEAQSLFEISRKEHIKSSVRESIVTEKINHTFDKGSWTNESTDKLPDVLEKSGSKGFDKDKFNGTREQRLGNSECS